MGSIATMTALVLGLLVASTKSDYDREKKEVTQMAAKIDYLDRVLANYGPQAKESRTMLRTAVESALTRIWPEEKLKHAQPDPSSSWTEALPTSIERLSPQSDLQKSIQAPSCTTCQRTCANALVALRADGKLGLNAHAHHRHRLARDHFCGVGIFAPPNPTVIISLMMAALSVSAAILLILELDMPFGGIVKISSAPMRNALEHLGRR